MQSEELGLQHYVDILWRRKWVILSVFAVVFALSLIWISMSRTTYTVHSKIGIKNPLFHRQAIMPFAPGTDRPDQSLSGETLVQIINGLPFAEKVSSALARLPEPVAAEPQEIYASLNAEYQDPDLIKIHGRHVDPDRAVAFANAAADTFVLENRESLKSDIVSYIQYAQAQMEQKRKEVREAEAEITHFKEGLGFVNIHDEIANLKTTIAAFEKEAAAVQTEIEVQEAHRKESLSLAKISGDGSGSLLVDEPQIGHLRSLQTMLSEARLRYTGRHPTVINLENEIRDIEGRLRASLEASGSSLSPERYLSLRDELMETNARIADLKTARTSWDAQIAKVREKLIGFPEKQHQLELLEARAEEAKQAYGSWRGKLDDAVSKEKTVQGNASVIDYAKGARPAVRKTTNIALAFIVSLMLALGISFVTEFADTTLRTPEEITRDVGLGFLGSIIRLKEPRQIVFADSKGLSTVAEAFTRIYSNIKFAAVEGPLRTLLITSARKGEGKSTTLMNLACAMAASGKRIIVVDTDLRNPTLQRILKTKHQYGVTNVVAGECTLDDALQPTSHPGVTLLPAGPIPPNPAEMLQSSAVKDLIASLQTRCDMAIFDSPPALLVADAMLLGSELDAALIVSESGGVSRKEVQHVRDTLQAAKVRILGVILNKVVETPGAYYYNYYTYYRYYEEQQEEEKAPATPGAFGWLRASVKSISSRIGGRT